MRTTLRVIDAYRIRRYADAQIGFTAANMSGRTGPMGGPGRLEGASLNAYIADRDRVDYVVYSYATPIAWRRLDGTWCVVEQKFSPSTSRHQRCLRGLA